MGIFCDQSALPRTLTPALALAACLWNCAAHGTGWDGPPLQIPYATRAIRVDGEMQDWKDLAPMPLPYHKQMKSSVKAAWREDGLYFTVQSKDSVFNVDMDAPWKGDCFQIFVEKDNRHRTDAGADDPAVEQFVFHPAAQGKKGAACWRSVYGEHRTEGSQVSGRWQPGAGEPVAAFQRNEWGWSLECFIPAAYLAPATMADASRLTLHFALTNDGTPTEMFSVDHTLDDNHRNPSTWASVTLRPRVPEPVEPELPTKEPEPAVSAAAPTPAQQQADLAAADLAPLTHENLKEILKKAERLCADRRAPEAAELLKAEILKHPDSPYLHYHHGLASYMAGDHESAEGSWSRAAIDASGDLRVLAVFGTGNAAYRRAMGLPDSLRTWDTSIALYRRAMDSYSEAEQVPLLKNKEQENYKRATAAAASAYGKRGAYFLKEAAAQSGAIAGETLKIWQVDERARRLIRDLESAERDFREVQSLVPGDPAAAKALGEINGYMVLGLGALARNTVREVSEAGSTQNGRWMIEKYNEALALLERILTLRPGAAEAVAEASRIRQLMRGVYVREAEIEKKIADDILKKRKKMREMEARLQTIKANPSAYDSKEMVGLEHGLTIMADQFPPYDPEDALRRWDKAVENYKISIGFDPADTATPKLLKELQEKMAGHRIQLGEEYFEDAGRAQVNHDEDADRQIQLYENALRHTEKALAENPSKAGALAKRLGEMKPVTARAFLARGSLYQSMGDQRREQYLDRAVAYYEKAGQDYQQATRLDPALAEAGTALASNRKGLLAMRQSLSQQIAAGYAAASAETANQELKVDESELLQLGLQEDKTGRELNEVPEPIYNW